MPTKKWCFVPACTNTSFKTPEKVFVCVPTNLNTKKKWFKAVRRSFTEVSPKSSLYCCEDHFNLKEDMENYLEYTLSKVRARMKPNVIPHIFTSKPDKRISSRKPDLRSEKKVCKRTISKYLERRSAKLEKQEEPRPSTSKVKMPQKTKQIKKNKKIDASCQTKHQHFRSKAVQISMKPTREDVATSLKFAVPDRLTVSVKQRLQFSTDEALHTDSDAPAESSHSYYQPSHTSQSSSLSDATTQKHESNQMKTTHLFKRLAFRDLY